MLAYQAADSLKAGRLRIVLAKFEQPALPIHIVYPTSRLLSAKVRTFIDLVTEISRLAFRLEYRVPDAALHVSACAAEPGPSRPIGSRICRLQRLRLRSFRPGHENDRCYTAPSSAPRETSRWRARSRRRRP